MPSREEAYQEYLVLKREMDTERNKFRGAVGKAPLPMVSPGIEMQRQRMLDLYNSPEMLGYTPEEEAQYLAGVRRTGEDTMQSQGANFDVWAARRGISGTPVANQRIKLMQELIRNQTSAKMHVNDLGFRSRTNARLQALQGLGNVEQGIQGVDQQRYQAELLEQLAQDQMYGQLLGYGGYGVAKKFLGGGSATNNFANDYGGEYAI